MMNAREKAIANFRNSILGKGPYAPTAPRFTNPNPKRGYYAVLKLLAKGNVPTRKAILMNLGLPSQHGYYTNVFQNLIYSELISYDRARGYSITKLGRDFIKENPAF